MKKPENITTDAGFDRVKSASPSVELPAAQARVNAWTQAWAKVRSWFAIPYGYEDEAGFHNGREPAPVQPNAASSDPREIFTDHACDSGTFMAATSTDTSPAPAPKPPVAAPRE